jgi:hypothetical protein
MSLNPFKEELLKFILFFYRSQDLKSDLIN